MHDPSKAQLQAVKALAETNLYNWKPFPSTLSIASAQNSVPTVTHCKRLESFTVLAAPFLDVHKAKLQACSLGAKSSQIVACCGSNFMRVLSVQSLARLWPVAVQYYDANYVRYAPTYAPEGSNWCTTPRWLTLA